MNELQVLALVPGQAMAGMTGAAIFSAHGRWRENAMTASLIVAGALVTLSWLSFTGRFLYQALRSTLRGLPKWWAILLLIVFVVASPLVVVYIALGLVSRYILIAVLWPFAAAALLFAATFNIGTARARLSRTPPGS